MDLREMGEGSRLFLSVWKPRARIFTGDSHALQGVHAMIPKSIFATALRSGISIV